MSEPASVETSLSAVPPPVPDFPDPGRLLRMSRGFSCLFWSMPLMSAAHALALASVLPPRWTMGILLGSFLPLVCGLWMLGGGGNPAFKRGGRMDFAVLAAAAAMFLSPFLAWWAAAPDRIYFAVNAALHYLATIGLLAGLNGLSGACARRLGDLPLKRESAAGLGMVLWLSGCTAGALAWLFHRSGILEAGLATVLAHVSQLPSEARTLFMLPYAMTAYVMWRAKETGLRCAIRPAP